MKKEGKNKYKATIIMMMLVFSMVFVISTLPTVCADNTAPTINNPHPTNESTGQSLTPTINATVTDTDGNNSIVDFYYSLSDSPYNWVHFNHQTGKLNVSVSTTATFAIEYGTTYWWKMTANDTHDNTTSALWWFTTNQPPVLGMHSHENSSTGKLLKFKWDIWIDDADGDFFKWDIECSNGQSNGDTGARNGTKNLTLSGLAYSTSYKVWVNATDPVPAGSGQWTRRWYTFTTMAEGSYNGSIYVVGSGTRRIYEYSKETLEYLQCSDYRCPGDLYAVNYDDTYVYAAGGDVINATKVFQFYRSDLTLKQSTPDNYGGRINFIVLDDNYFYIGGEKTNKTYQYWKSNMTKKAETSDYGGIIFSIAIDDTYIYVGGRQANNIKQYWKSNMTFKKATPVIAGDIFIVDNDETYVYAAGNMGITYQYWKSNMTLKASTPASVGSIYSMSNDDTYVYVGGLATDRVFQYYKSDMTLKLNTLTYGGNIWALDDDTYIYAGGETINKVYQYRKTDLIKIAESSSYGDNIYRLIVTKAPPVDYPVFGTPSPANNSDGNLWSFTWSIPISDPEGNTFNWTIQCSNGQVNIGSGTNGTKSVILSGLAYSTTYKVWVNATDPAPAGSGQWTRRWYTFTTKANLPPVLGTPSPVNGSIGNLWSFTWSIPISDPEVNLFSWTINCSNGQHSAVTGASSGTKSLSLSGLGFLTTYTVWVNATDPVPAGSGLYSRKWYTFTTQQNNPVFGMPSPVNGSTGTPLSLSWSIPISDLQGDPFNWSINCSNGQHSIVTGASNGTKLLSLSGLGFLTTYTVWVNATDPVPAGSGLYTRRWFTFTTVNDNPVFGMPSPVNDSTVTPLSLTWSIPISDPDSDLFSWTINCSNGQHSAATGASNGTKSLSLSGLEYPTSYTVWVNATDPAPVGSGQWTRKWYKFTTKGSSGNDDSNTPPSGDTTLPTTPTNVKCTTLGNDNTPSFSWTKSTDASGISGYYVKIDSGTDTLVGNVTSWTSSNIIADGAHTFYVKAKDGNGNIGNNGSCSFTINTTVVEKPPIADAGGPYTGLTNQEITFDGSKSTDTDGTITGYRWDWTNDGTYDTDWLTTATTTHVYLVAGKYTVNLQVKDNTGATSNDTATVDIIENTDDDDDGLSDIIETQLGSDPNDKSDVTSVVIDGTTYYMVDTNKDGQIDTFYNPGINKSTVLVLENGKYKIDMDGDGKLDHLYNPASGETSVYKPEEDKGFPWIYIIILVIIIVIILIIAVLFKTGFIYVEKKYEAEESTKDKEEKKE